MKRLFKYFAGFVLLFSVWAATPQTAAAQCPMCKAAVESGSEYGKEGNQLASGLNTGILYMFVLPYLMLMGLAFLFYRGYRKKQKARELAEGSAMNQALSGNHGPGADLTSTDQASLN